MSKFSKVFYDNEILDGFQVIDLNWNRNGICKRCGKSFTKKYKENVFCSKGCVSKYRNKINKMKDQYGKKFTDWLDNKV